MPPLLDRLASAMGFVFGTLRDTNRGEDYALFVDSGEAVAQNCVVRTGLIVVLFCVATSLFAAPNSNALYTVQSPRGIITVSLHRLRVPEDGRVRATYFYAVRESVHDNVVYLPSQLERSTDGERTKFSECIDVHWSPSESAFVLQERFPADSPCGRLHIVGSPRSALEIIPYEHDFPAMVARVRKKHPEWPLHLYAPWRVTHVTDTEATIDFYYYRRTYRYADRGVPKR